MGTVWVLQTETKGTGANVVPLERAEKRSSAVEPLLAPGKPRPRKQPEPRPKAPRRFRVLDVMTRQQLADNASHLVCRHRELRRPKVACSSAERSGERAAKL